MAQPQAQAQQQQQQAPPPQQQQQQQSSPPQPPSATPPPAPFASTSLYVGDLDPNVSEAQLYEVFSHIAPVVSIRVCRDVITRRSLGYAYVNYNSAQDATRALDMLNFSTINGKAVRIMYSHRDPSLRKSGTANIFIKNLDRTIDHKALYDTFVAFGNILSCKVATDPTGQSKGYGFVQFEQDEAAQMAIDRVNGMLLAEKQVYVGPFVRRQERDQASSATKFNNVYVKNLSESVTDEELRATFGVYGPITSAVVMRDGEGRSKCFGFVNFENSDDAARSVDGLNGKILDGKEWYVGRAQKKSEREAELRSRFEQERKERMEKYQGANLYLKNLDDTIDDERLRELFAEFGTITSCKVMRDPVGQSRGSGFVAFASPEEATRAVTEMNGRMVGNKPLYVALAQRKEERKARLQAQFSSQRLNTGVATVPASVSMYHPAAPGMGAQQIFYGQPHPGLMPQPSVGFGYQQQVLAASIRPGVQVPNYFVPVVQRQPGQPQRSAGRRGTGSQQPQPQNPQQQQQQFLQRGGNRAFRYTMNARNTGMVAVDPNLTGAPQGVPVGAMLPVPVDMGVSIPTPEPAASPISALATALASAPPEQQRTMLGENLYPLVERLEHDHAGKVTGMLLEMDQTEVLHLIESAEALQAKVAEAMEVLKNAQAQVQAPPTDELAALQIGDAQAAA